MIVIFTGMHVLISDVRQEAVERSVVALRSEFAQDHRLVKGCIADVRREVEVRALLQFALTEFDGAPIQFVAANAGILLAEATVLSGTEEEWNRTFGVNVLGVANTCRVLVPHLLSQPRRSAISITASLAGLINGSVGPYRTSKLASAGIAEALDSEIGAAEQAGAPGTVSVVALCPGIVKTSLHALGSKGITAVESDRGEMFRDAVSEVRAR